jgi:hypothetical protein
MADGKRSIDQLCQEIHKMLEETAAQATVDMEYILSCFEMDQQGNAKKITYVNFDPLRTTSTSAVKQINLPYPDLVLRAISLLR